MSGTQIRVRPSLRPRLARTGATRSRCWSNRKIRRSRRTRRSVSTRFESSPSKADSLGRRESGRGNDESGGRRTETEPRTRLNGSIRMTWASAVGRVFSRSPSRMQTTRCTNGGRPRIPPQKPRRDLVRGQCCGENLERSRTTQFPTAVRSFTARVRRSLYDTGLTAAVQ